MYVSGFRVWGTGGVWVSVLVAPLRCLFKNNTLVQEEDFAPCGNQGPGMPEVLPCPLFVVSRVVHDFLHPPQERRTCSTRPVEPVVPRPLD